jgi:hypothetical protein
MSFPDPKRGSFGETISQDRKYLAEMDRERFEQKKTENEGVAHGTDKQKRFCLNGS